jgi:hypothetical protein
MDTYFYFAFIQFADGSTGMADGVTTYDRNLIASDYEHIRDVMIKADLQKKFVIQIDGIELRQFNKVS